jgi:hypothetical protein
MKHLKVNPFLLILTVTFLLLAGAFINKFPLVYADTGAYINNGHVRETPSDRTITYSLFIRLTSLGHSLWYVVFFQSLILSYLLVRVFTFTTEKVSVYGSIIIIAFVCTVSGVIWYSGQLMPDVFTPVAILSLVLLLVGNFNILETIFIAGIFVVAAASHSSNLLSTLLTFIILLITMLTSRAKKGMVIPLRKWMMVGMLVIAPWLLLPSLHLWFGGNFVVNRGTPVFLMGKLVENGIMKEYLYDHCETEQLKLCPYRDSLPNSASFFIWEPSSPLYKIGGWEANKEEFSRIEKETFTNPKYFLRNAEESVIHTMIQLFENRAGEGLTKNLEQSNTYWKIKEWFPFEFEEYTDSLQNSNLLNFKNQNRLQTFFLIISVLIVAGFLFRKFPSAYNPRMRMLISGVVIFIFCNAFVTASLANALNRLQGRVSWLFIFVACLVLIENAEHLPLWIKKILIVRQ